MPDPGTLRRVLITVAAGGFGIWLAYTDSIEPRGSLRWLGLALAIIGLLGVTAARWTLGKSFSVSPQARELVTRGIYCKLRNPIYVTGTIYIAGVVLIIGVPWLWAAFVILIVVQVFRARQEAKVLEAKFGDDYRRYRAQTWF